MSYNIIDLFAGVGGLSYGFSLIDDFNIIMANEINKDISIAYSLNHPDVKMLNCDIKDIKEKDIQDILKNKNVDIIIRRPTLSIIFYTR